MESPLIHDGSQTVAGFNANSTAALGPGGSRQYTFVRLSTLADRTVLNTTLAGQLPYGVLQNKPSTGEAADVGIFGVTNLVAGTTSVAAGVQIMADTSGNAIAYSSAAGRVAAGIALETPSAAGQVFTAAIYGFGNGGGSAA